MDVLDTRDELVGQEEDRLQGELPVAEVEEIFQARAEKIQHHRVVVAFGSKPTDEGNTDTTGKRLVDTGLIFELRMLGLDRFKFDGNLFARDDVGSKVDITERTGADLSADAVLITDAEVLRRISKTGLNSFGPPVSVEYEINPSRQAAFVDILTGIRMSCQRTPTFRLHYPAVTIKIIHICSTMDYDLG